MLLCTFLIPVLLVTQAGRLSSVATISMKDVGNNNRSQFPQLILNLISQWRYVDFCELMPFLTVLYSGVQNCSTGPKSLYSKLFEQFILAPTI
jgi:hypothetical protein